MKNVQVRHDDRIIVEDKGLSYLHCAKCLREKPKGVSPKEWARQQVALTRDGIQVWCTRHEVNIDLITFVTFVIEEDE